MSNFIMADWRIIQIFQDSVVESYVWHTCRVRIFDLVTSRVIFYKII